jgi:Na+/H+ antiporter NhaD/arsenite permease-like protein
MPEAAASAALPAWTVVPFAALLGAIAVLPLVRRTAHWWESNGSKFLVSAGCGIVALASIALLHGPTAAGTAFRHAMAEFVPFIVLLFSLFAISGGILVTGDLRGTPRINASILMFGALVANVLGTTGASMLLIRPILRANQGRRHRAHVVVFFIFMVSNTGGLLLPIGDPPLFLGYLRGVPFGWTLGLWGEWLAVNLLVLGVFYAVDRTLARREGIAPEHTEEMTEPPVPTVRVSGAENLLWLAGVIGAAAFLVPGRTLGATGVVIPNGAREAVMAACAGMSLWRTPKPIRAQNRFNFVPIVEVAALFSGLFVAMQPALELLTARGAELGLRTPAQFFWATGLLSSFLDNAPTYLVFADVARTVTPDGFVGGVQYSGHPVDPALLAAVSCGAVFMGANTYIGNGPNLMVAAIAREEGVPMPTFFGYMLWSGAVLLPIFALVTVVWW